MVGGDNIAENPRPSLRTAANRNPIAPGLTHHRNRIRGLENVTITEDRNIQGFLDARNVIPMRLARVMLGLGARMDRHGRRTKFLGDLRSLKAGFVSAINSHADLDRHRDLAATRVPAHACLRDNGAQQVGVEVAFPRKRRSPALSRHFGDRATEVQVDMVGVFAVDHDLGGTSHDLRVHSVELHGEHALGRIRANHRHRPRASLDEGSGGHHLHDVQARRRINVGRQFFSRTTFFPNSRGRGRASAFSSAGKSSRAGHTSQG